MQAPFLSRYSQRLKLGTSWESIIITKYISIQSTAHPTVIIIMVTVADIIPSIPISLPSQHPPDPIILHPLAIHHHHAAAPSDAILTVPPQLLLLFLAGLLGLGIAVGETAIAALGANDQDHVVAHPRLQGRHHAAVLAGQRLLQVNDLRLDVAQDVRVAVGGREGQDEAVLLDEGLRLRIDGVVGCVRTGGADPAMTSVINRLRRENYKKKRTYTGLRASSDACAWAWSMLEKDELRDGGGR
jgi:hypothetical protein